MPSEVSILVLVDGALEEIRHCVFHASPVFQSLFSWMVRSKIMVGAPPRTDVDVSILVLVDGALEACEGGKDGSNWKVSILVLVDGALEGCGRSHTNV